MLKIDIKIEIVTNLFSDNIMLMLLMVMIGVLYVLINYKINFSSKRVHCSLLVNIIIGKKGSSGFAADQNKIQILFLHLLLKLKELLSEETENQVLKLFFLNFCVGSYNNTKGQQHREKREFSLAMGVFKVFEQMGRLPFTYRVVFLTGPA